MALLYARHWLILYGGKDASHARFQPPLSVLMYRSDRLASQSPGRFALKPACWYSVVARIELALDGSKPSALTIWLYHFILPLPLVSPLLPLLLEQSRHSQLGGIIGCHY